MTPIEIFNISLFVLFTVFFAYQSFYILYMFISKPSDEELHKAEKQHRFAVVVAAHNEELVVGNLVKSVKAQHYPAELLDIFVIADNCSDNTAKVARDAGAHVFERMSSTHIGKSYVMKYAFDRIKKEFPDAFDAYLIFDADNLLPPDYVKNMNDTFDTGLDVITSYRASKNFGSNWISGGYGLWFLRESKYLNNARMRLKTGCAVSGTGYLISQHILDMLGEWDFHLLTEDIQFSTWCAINKIRIGFSPNAVFYDEQPKTFSASWNQRMRWTRGFYQVFAHYGGQLFKTAFVDRHFAAYDMLMTIAPGALLTILSVIVNTGVVVYALVVHTAESMTLLGSSLFSLAFIFGAMYLIFLALGILTTITERENILASSSFRIKNIFTFPLFMVTYVPIAVWALVKKVQWVPTVHTENTTLDEVLD